MVNVRMLFNINPRLLRETAKGRTYEQFISYLESQPNFQVIEFMSENERKELYQLSMREEK